MEELLKVLASEERLKRKISDLTDAASHELMVEAVNFLMKRYDIHIKRDFKKANGLSLSHLYFYNEIIKYSSQKRGTKLQASASHYDDDSFEMGL